VSEPERVAAPAEEDSDAGRGAGGPPPRAAASDLRRPLFYAFSAAVVAVVVSLSHDVMLPFVLALVIAYVLTPLVAWVERRGVPRGAAIALVYVVVLGSIGLFGRLTAPRVGQELLALRREIPEMLRDVRDVWIPRAEEKLHDFGLAPAPRMEERVPHAPAFVLRQEPDGTIGMEVGSGARIVQTKSGYALRSGEEKEEANDASHTLADALGASFTYVQHNALELARIGRDIVLGLGRAVFVFGITLMLAAYLIVTREKVLQFFLSLVRPKNRADFRLLLERVDQGLAGVVRGQLVICLINGALCAVGFALIGLKYWPVLAIVATIFSLIPIFGSIASAVPAVMFGLTQSLGTALVVLLFIIGVHQVEANFLNPKIMGDSAKIHPVLVILSLLVGEHFFQAVGALLAVPAMSIAQSLFLHFRDMLDRTDPDFRAETVGAMASKEMVGRTPEPPRFANETAPR
jgi:predicted PurR-regulated permease PerM